MTLWPAKNSLVVTCAVIQSYVADCVISEITSTVLDSSQIAHVYAGVSI